jgi:hypothetical protein
LLAVGPDVAKLLAVVTLGEDVFLFISLYLDGNVAESGKFKELYGFCRPWRCHKEQGKGKVMFEGPSWGRRAADICLTLMASKPMSTSPSAMSSAGVLIGRWRITALIGFSAFGQKV